MYDARTRRLFISLHVITNLVKAYRKNRKMYDISGAVLRFFQAKAQLFAAISGDACGCRNPLRSVMCRNPLSVSSWQVLVSTDFLLFIFVLLCKRDCPHRSPSICSAVVAFFNKVGQSLFQGIKAHARHHKPSRINVLL
jgi:hypothetical protein